MKLKWIVIPAVIAAVAIYVFHFKKNRDVPIYLIGKWTTSASGYQDRPIELTKKTFTYGLGGGKKDVYLISSIEKDLEGNVTLYTLSYKNTDGLEFTRSFYYNPADGETIKFKHQEHIEWRKENDPKDDSIDYTPSSNLKDDTVEENLKTDPNKKAG